MTPTIRDEDISGKEDDYGGGEEDVDNANLAATALGFQSHGLKALNDRHGLICAFFLMNKSVYNVGYCGNYYIISYQCS